MLQKRYVPLLVVLCLAALGAVAGVLLRAPEPPIPIKILMPNAGGRVVFNHRQHVEDYNLKCIECHHESESARDNPQPCGACHGVAFNDVFLASHQQTFAGDAEACLTCHHTEIKSTAWDIDLHDMHAESIADSCETCHHEIDDFGMDPQSCYDSGCHERLEPGQPVPVDAEPLIYRDAVHTVCASCHPHSDSFEDGLAGCASCHELSESRKEFVQSSKGELTREQISSFSKCATCHYDRPAEEIMPDRMGAYHGQCGDCHERMSGPSVSQPKDPNEKEQCYQCHIR